MKQSVGFCSVILGLLFGTMVTGAGRLTMRSTDEFSKPTIDLGIVVSDLEKSTAFYTQAIGFKNSREFSVDADFAKRSGLTDSHELHIQVFTLGSGADATEIKLMQLPGVTSRTVDHQYIHSSLGFSYLTIHIQSTDAALARLKRAGVQPIAEGPVAIPGTDWYLTNVRDPDGNLIELVGPR
jgi:lactoylglutathione lyase